MGNISLVCGLLQETTLKIVRTVFKVLQVSIDAQLTASCSPLAGHQAYCKGTECFENVVKAFGAEVVDEKGEINRKVLGGKVFSDKVGCAGGLCCEILGCAVFISEMIPVYALYT